MVVRAQEENEKTRIWEAYLNFVRSSRSTLLFADEVIRHLLFFVPFSSSRDSRWAEILFGILQLNQLSIDLASTEQLCQPKNAYGTSVALVSAQPSFPATGIRIALTILQCLYPVVQEVVRSDQEAVTHRRQTTVRRMVERVRFVLRLSLLMRYMLDLQKSSTVSGLMLEGGLYSDHTEFAPTIAQERSRIEREKYVGPRSGRQIYGPVGQRRHTMIRDTVKVKAKGLASRTMRWLKHVLTQKIRSTVGELLYILRPLVQAEAHAQILPSDSWRLRIVWLCCLWMDAVSLLALRDGDSMGNPWTAREWNRRKMRLWLYLLRTPVWEDVTLDGIEQATGVLEQIPLLGGMLRNYVWETIHYWKLYRAEEG